METYRNEEQMKCLAKSEGCSVFRMENATGEGTIAMYELFPGVMLGFNDFHMDYFDSGICAAEACFCIDHLQGRGGCSMWRMRMPTPMWRQEI